MKDVTEAGTSRKNMATIVRVKRRRDEDPLEYLLISHKKPKVDAKLKDNDAVNSPENVFKFAGTVYSKDACISKPVKDAIRKAKLEREYKQHETNTLGHVKHEARKSQRHQSQQSRYRVTAKHRTLALDLLDQAVLEENTESSNLNKDSKTDEYNNSVDHVKEKEDRKSGNDDSEYTENSEKNHKEDILCECDRKDPCQCAQSFDTKNTCSKEPTGAKCRLNKSDSGKGAKVTEQDEGKTTSSEGADSERMFCLVDMEADVPLVTLDSVSAGCNKILCNGVPLEREVIAERGTDDSYVYDLYYTNSHDFDFRMLENVLTVEAFRQDLRSAEDDFDEEDQDYEDEDSNDEGNWRNDYPDEDPGFYDHRDVGFYGNDMDENLAFETETGNQLADWMSWRCNIENEVELSSDDEVEEYETSGKSYEAYYRKIRKEMQTGEGSDESDLDS